MAAELYTEKRISLSICIWYNVTYPKKMKV